jgi:ubiquinone/menaquinone biosynthesis C-methylase UbiE
VAFGCAFLSTSGLSAALRQIAPGRVIGVDRAPDVLAQANAHAIGQGVSIELHVGDVYALQFPDASFDVVHAHQLLQHLSEPVRALTEMRRVLRPGGIVAARDGHDAHVGRLAGDRRWADAPRRHGDAERDDDRPPPACLPRR